ERYGHDEFLSHRSPTGTRRSAPFLSVYGPGTTPRTHRVIRHRNGLEVLNGLQHFGDKVFPDANQTDPGSTPTYTRALPIWSHQLPLHELIRKVEFLGTGCSTRATAPAPG